MDYRVGVLGTGAIGVEHIQRISQRIGGTSAVAFTGGQRPSLYAPSR